MFIIVLVFSFIVVSNNKGLNLGLALLTGGSILLLLSGQFTATLPITFDLLTEVSSWDLLLAVNLVQVLSVMLEEKGILKRIVAQLRLLITSPRLILLLIPTFLGFLPSPGVILLASPLIEEAASGYHLKDEDLALITYWYRIATVVISPLAFTFILAIGITGLSPIAFLGAILPIGVILVLYGYFYILKPLPLDIKNDVVIEKKKIVSRLLGDCFFLIMILFCFLILNLPISISMGAAIVFEFFYLKISVKEIKDYIFKVPQNLTLIVFGVIFFKEVLNETAVVVDIINQALELGLPLAILALVLPIGTGLIIGSPMGTIALVFPVFTPIFSTVPQFMIIYMLSRLACVLSPINTTKIVVVDYFGIEESKLLRKMALGYLPVVALLIIIGILVV